MRPSVQVLHMRGGQAHQAGVMAQQEPVQAGRAMP